MDKTALFWLLNLNNFDEHPVWLRSNQFLADCHYWQCHSVKSQKVGIIYYYFPSVHARSRWTESRTQIGWSRGPDIFSGQLAFSSGPLEWWPFDYFDKWSSNYSQSTWQQQRQQKSVNITSSRLYIFDFEACSFCAPRSFFADFWINIPTSVYLTLG